MRTVAALACVALLATAPACTHRRNGIIVASVGAVGLVAASLAIRDCKNSGGCNDGVILALPVAVAVTIGGVLGAATAHPATTTPMIILPDRPPQHVTMPDAAPAPTADAAPASTGDAGPAPDAAPAPPPDARPAVIPLSPNRIP